MVALAPFASTAYVRPTRRGLQGRGGYATAVLLWVAVALAWAAPAPWAVQAGLLLGGLVLVGAPHGIFDIDVALWAAPRRGRVAWLTVLLAGYLGLMIVVAAGWAWAPGATLAGFLAVSVGHFGLEDGPARGACPALERGVGAGVRGAAVILGPALLHPASVDAVFAALAGTTPARVEAVTAAVAAPLVAVWVAGLAFTLAGQAKRRAGGEAAELLGLCALFAVAPPLLAFAVYFCGVHAVRHAVEMARLSGARGVRAQAGWAARRMAPVAAVLALGLAVALAASPRLTGATAASAVVWSFRLLAALTLPHLVLTPRLARRAASCRREAGAG